MTSRSIQLSNLARHAALAGLLLFAAGSLAIVLQPTDAAWWAARLLGLAALLTIAATMVLRPAPGRPRWHKWLGWLAAAALAGHIAVVAGLQPVVWQWLTPAMPVEIVAGIAALCAFLIALLVQRSRHLRRRLGPFVGHRIHRVAGHALVAAAGLHIALVAEMGIAAVVAITAALLIFVFEGIVHERHRAALIATLALFGLATIALAFGPLAEARLAPLRRSPVDHANFLHADHKGITCASCHHNFVDKTGRENCLTCHKRVSTSETMRIDRMFHVFCAECHRNDKADGKKFGAIDDCNGCHAVRTKGIGK